MSSRSGKEFDGERVGAGIAPDLAVPGALLARWPHLPAFWPGRRVVAAEGAGMRAVLALPEGDAVPRGWAGGVMRFSVRPFAPARFAGRDAPPLIVLAPGMGAGDEDGAAVDVPAAELRALAGLIARGRIGGPAGLPDPGGAAFDLPARGCAVVLDPCRADRAEAARAALEAARGTGRPVLLARDPWAGMGEPPVLSPARGERALPQPLAPWTLLDAAASLHGADEGMAALAEAAWVLHDWTGGGGAPSGGAGAAPRGSAGAAWRGLGGEPSRDLEGALSQGQDGAPSRGSDGALSRDGAVGALGGLLARARAADPFRGRPWGVAEALELLAGWAAAERENRRVSACLGISFWKRKHVAALLAHGGDGGGGGPAFTLDIPGAIQRARAEGGAVVSWASATPDALAAMIRREGAEVRLLEDGFVRSRGLGARFLPGASYCLDSRGAHYDARRESDLEVLLREGGFEAGVLARAARLREAIVARGVSKYNLGGGAAPPPVPGGRRAVLVVGQVEDDASMRLGGTSVRTNLGLLREVRAAEPDAYVLYKPHPDLEAGFRRGRLRAAELDGLADAVVEAGTPLTALFPLIARLHTITSLSGFEAILRGVPVTTWGRPFYAGWGLTEDMDPFPEGRRGVTRSVEELVAAALILYPRYLDPVTMLPCPVEVVLDRLEEPGAWRLSPMTLHRGVEGFVRRALARIAGRR